MNENRVIEIPESDFTQMEALLDEWLTLLNRIEAEQPQRELEWQQHTQQFDETMAVIRARLDHVEKVY